MKERRSWYGTVLHFICRSYGRFVLHGDYVIPSHIFGIQIVNLPEAVIRERSKIGFDAACMLKWIRNRPSMLYLPYDRPVSPSRPWRHDAFIFKLIYLLLVLLLIFAIESLALGVRWLPDSGKGWVQDTIDAYSSLFMCECSGQCNDLGTPIPGNGIMCF